MLFRAFCAIFVLWGWVITAVMGDGSPPAPVYWPLQVRSARVAEMARPLFFAFVPDGLAAGDADEAFALHNPGANPIRLRGWQVSDGEGTVTLPDLTLAGGDILWCARQAAAFSVQWAQAPACEYGGDTDPTVPDAVGSAPLLANAGDELLLRTPAGLVADSVVFAGGNTATPGWQGPAVDYYRRHVRFVTAGQVFYRLFDPATGRAEPDTDTARDWVQGNPDPVRGRRAAYVGWDWVALAQPVWVENPAGMRGELFIAPDNSFTGIAAALAGAQDSIWLETYDLEHRPLVELLAAKARAGVEVRVLLEGGPVSGLTHMTRWAAQQVVAAGGRVHFMVNDSGITTDRYAYQHAKFAVIDGRRLLVSTENVNHDAMPPDATDGETLGRRGYAVLLDEPTLAARAQAIFLADNDPAHADILAWQPGHPTYGAPPPGFVMPRPADRRGYPVRYPAPLPFDDVIAAALFSAPESSLYPSPLLELLERAGPGDVILAQQLYEHPFWGSGVSHPVEDPNPRLEALIAAARRGAQVRLLLDGFFDTPTDPRSNAATVAYVNGIAQREGLDLVARLGNPTGLGLHAKLHLLTLSGSERAGRWVVLGSLNGSEVSHKLNRELAVALASDAAHARLSEVFWMDWAAAGF